MKPKAEPTMRVTVVESYAHQAEWDAWWRMLREMTLQRLVAKKTEPTTAPYQKTEKPQFPYCKR